MLHRSVDIDLIKLAHDGVFQAITKPRHLLRLFSHFLIGDLAGLAKTYDSGHVQRSGAHATLVAAAVDLRDKLHARVLAANVECAHTLRTVKLVGRDRCKVDIVLNHIERNLANSLHRIRVEQHAALVTDYANLADRLLRADLVVGGHDADQNGLIIHGPLEIVEIDATVLLNREIGHTETVLLQTLAGVEHSLVFDRLRDDVVALLAIHFGDALER